MGLNKRENLCLFLSYYHFLTLAGWFIFLIFHFLVAEEGMQLFGSKGEQLIFKSSMLEPCKSTMVWIGRDFTDLLVPVPCLGRNIFHQTRSDFIHKEINNTLAEIHAIEIIEVPWSNPGMLIQIPYERMIKISGLGFFPFV